MFRIFLILVAAGIVLLAAGLLVLGEMPDRPVTQQMHVVLPNQSFGGS